MAEPVPLPFASTYDLRDGVLVRRGQRPGFFRRAWQVFVGGADERPTRIGPGVFERSGRSVRYSGGHPAAAAPGRGGYGHWFVQQVRSAMAGAGDRGSAEDVPEALKHVSAGGTEVSGSAP